MARRKNFECPGRGCPGKGNDGNLIKRADTGGPRRAPVARLVENHADAGRLEVAIFRPFSP